MSKTKFLEKLKEDNRTELGRFQNEYGELYIIYKFNTGLFGGITCITGDELNWEEGWQTNSEGQIFQEFICNPAEQEEIKRILNEN